MKFECNVEFTDNSAEIREALERGIVAGLYEAAGEIQARTIRNSRRDSGHTIEHYKTHVDESTLTAFIGSDVINAVYEEFGTGEFALDKSKSKRSVWCVPVEKVTGKKKPTFHGKVVIIERDGKKFYKTNGKKPTRALFNAFTKGKKSVERLIANAIVRALNK